jgi:hypothetical protein
MSAAVAAVRPSVQTAPKARGSFFREDISRTFKISEGAGEVLFLELAPRRLCEPTAGRRRRAEARARAARLRRARSGDFGAIH